MERMDSNSGEIRQMAKKYVDAIVKVIEDLKVGSNPKVEMVQLAKEVIAQGYALGVIAGSLSDTGIEGFTLALDGIRISLITEMRKEKMQYAVWDKNGDLHTSDEGTTIGEGGEK